MIYKVANIIKRAFSGPSPKEIELTDEFNRAIGLVERAVDSLNIAICQGPPGTGKTRVFTEAIRRKVDKIGMDEVIVYEAPTNTLVADMLERVSMVLCSLGYNERDVRRLVRVYGSQFNYSGFEELGRGVESEVRVIITTEYQRVYSDTHRTFHIMLDEASRSTLHEPFIALTNELEAVIDGRTSLYGSISVIGDPMQAIALKSEHRKKREERLVIERFVSSLLKYNWIEPPRDTLELMKTARDNLEGKHFAFLGITYRLPEPTERPISEGYYAGQIRAQYTAKERLQGLWEGSIPPADRDVTLDRIYEVVETAVTSEIPIIIIEPSSGLVRSGVSRSFSAYKVSEVEKGILYDPLRSKLGVAFAVALAYSTRKSTCVIAPYRDQVAQMKLFYQCHYENLLRKKGLNNVIRFTTVQKMLGSEADIVIAVLGKEYFGTEDSPTVYFQEPELFNVQLSRHRRMLVIIGDIRRLYRDSIKAYQSLGMSYKYIMDSIKVLWSLTGLEQSALKRFEQKDIRHTGNSAIYWRYYP